MSALIPEISFIVPVYNDEKYLPSCLGSILAQEDINFEIIVINDGSCDGSLDIAEFFAQTNQRVKVFSFENSGLSISRNRGIEKANGKYIQFVDSDDMLPKNSISSLVDKMKREEIDFFCGSALLCNEDDCVLKQNEQYNRIPSGILTGQELLISSLKLQFIPSSCLYIVKKSVLEGIRFFPHIYHEDNLFTIQVYLSERVKRAVHSSSVMYYRRIRPGSITQINPNVKHFQGYFTVACELNNELNSGNYDHKTNSAIQFLEKKMITHTIYIYPHIKFINRGALFFKVFKFMPLQKSYMRLHLKNVYYFFKF